ncbi:glycosyltransferase family 4 protein [Streptomyces oceani]|uniref:D-inositol 3-phosphate glycosyltransferase n=1 Tax=Streptomyces oceani TaxID=1075402 RepID=A0A1E7KJ42_9ACTN|nr:glycosyltransferase family 4 protein [Streptomyces oceani]OEV03968.1 UDP-glucose--polyglycerol phosphate glucosyltransferase [Streptomyces oceani]
MRIAYLLLHAWGMGGTIRTVMNQANTLVAAGHEVELVSAVRHRDEVRFPLDPRVRVTALTDSRGASAPTVAATPSDGQSDKPKEDAPLHIPRGEFGYRYFNRHLEDAIMAYCSGVRDIDVLVSTRPGLNFLVARSAPKSIVRVAQEHMNLSVHRPDVRKSIKDYYPKFDAVAVLTHRDREDYGELLPKARILRIPNAVHEIEPRSVDYDSKIVSAAGRLAPQKGFDMLLPAFQKVAERHPDSQLRIYGGGEKKAELREQIEKLHLYNHVYLMGHTSQLDKELAKSSVYVLSSRFEGLPMVMIEAMTHGLCVVSFDCPTGPADVLTDGQEGLLVPAEDVDALADALCTVLDDADLRRRMGGTARESARDYAPAAVHPQWEKLFEELLAERGTKAGQR